MYLQEKSGNFQYAALILKGTGGSDDQLLGGK
jgi:hypothetical protein